MRPPAARADVYLIVAQPHGRAARLVNDDALRKGKEMPTLIHFLLVRLSTGFLLGAALAGALVAINGPALGNPDSALEVGLLMYAFGSSFAIGYLASAMVIEFS